MIELSPQKVPRESQPQQRISSMFLKANLRFSESIQQFFYYLNGDRSYIIAKSWDQILVFNTVNKTKENIQMGTQNFKLNRNLPPYLFSIFQDRYIYAYKMGNQKVDKPDAIRISKMEPLAIARFNKGYFVGGYNRSSLPGNKRTISRSVYYINTFKTQGKNYPDDRIHIKDSDCPVSYLSVQNPYIFVYCHPVAYLITIASKSIVITFQKDWSQMILLQGRFAVSTVNGVGMTSKNRLFTFDVQRIPIFGVEFTQHKELCEGLCMQRTGKIFGRCGKRVYEYNPIKQESRTVVEYPQGEYIVWIQCTANNNLMVLRKQSKSLVMDVFGIE